MAPQNLYDFGGLLVRSGFPLPGVQPAAGEIGGRGDIVITIDVENGPPAEATDKPEHVWRGRYGLALERRGPGWAIRSPFGGIINLNASGETITCNCPDATRLPLLRSILVRRVLPRVSSLHDRLTLHAAALGHKNGGVVLFGSSGTGKSTLTAACALANGWQVLGDDMIVVSDLHRAGTESPPKVWPTLPGVSLWQQSKEALGVPDADCTPLPGYEGKVWYTPPCADRVAPKPVKALIFLSSTTGCSDLALRKLSSVDALVMAASQITPFNPQDAEEAGRQITAVKRLIEKVPSFALAYPREFQAIPAVLETIRRLCENNP